ncbi:MAG: DNA replication/repair protein RecF [Nitriliruptoraceae bacterium]
MWVRTLELTDIRSYAQARVAFTPGVTLLLGRNAQGKTNLVEALHRIATGVSHRTASDTPLVRAEASDGIVRTEFETDEGRRRTVELQLSTQGRGRIRVDGQDVRRAADAVGALRTVMFSPEDVAIVRGDPEQRRRFLDEVLAQRRPAYGAARQDYDRVLRQRNQLLRRLRALAPDAARRARDTLESWTEQAITLGTQITAARLAAVRALDGPVDRLYREFADRPEQIRVTYRPPIDLEVTAATDGPSASEIAEAMRRTFDQRLDEELRRATTLVGPHRDDVDLHIGSLAARAYSSQGEAWSLAMSLRLASHQLLAEVGDRPVVILDDVFAELDDTRRQRLADACTRFDQVFVTAATGAEVPLQGTVLRVVLRDGRSEIGRDDVEVAS